jgi:hypothetical protein
MVTTRQRGFLLPLVTLLMVLFSGAWLLSHESPSSTERNLMASLQLQQQLLFWHRGVLHFYRQMGYWPENLSVVQHAFQVPSPHPSITGLAAPDGFEVRLIGVEKNVISPVILPLKQYVQRIESGGYLIAIRPASSEVHDPRLIIRTADGEVLVSSAIDFAGFSLRAAAIAANNGRIQDMRNRELQAQSFSSQSLSSGSVTALDILLGSHSLRDHQQRIELLYEQLWYCVRVTQRCVQSQVM